MPTTPPVTTFDPHDPADLATFARELSARTGRPWHVSAAAGCYPGVDLVTDPGDPTWRPGDWASVQFLAPGTYWLVGRSDGRPFDRRGRYHAVGPIALAWVVSRVIASDLAGDPPRTCPGPPPGERK